VTKVELPDVGSEGDDRGAGRFCGTGEIGIERSAGGDDERGVFSARGQPGARFVRVLAWNQLGRPGNAGQPAPERLDPRGTRRGKKQKDVATHRHSHLSMPTENGS
jgi:hypothetical protein